MTIGFTGTSSMNGDAPVMSKCRICGMGKSASCFYRERKTGKIITICKDCVRIANKKFHVANAEKIHSRKREKYLQNSEKERERRREHYQLHKKEKYEYSSQYKKRNPEKYRRYRAERAYRLGEANFSLVEWEKICKFYGNKCLRCQKEKKLTIDHVVPASLGGSNKIDNLQPLCTSCNSQKNAKYIDYRPDKGEFAKRLLLERENDIEFLNTP